MTTATHRQPIVVLMADDDPDDRDMAREAFVAGRLANHLSFVVDGEDLMDYLRRQGKYAPPASAPRPGLILLDLKMPRKDGFEALQEIRADPDLRAIPVVALTTSQAEEDILRSYNLGVSSFIIKPVTFDRLVDVIRHLARYWFEIVKLPDGRIGK
jgi:CheY-like chemotaxis protein